MRKFFLLSSIIISYCFNAAYGQQGSATAQTMPATPRKANYTKFSQPAIVKTDEILKANKGFEQDPELGVVYKNTPKEYYEVLGKRTEMTKTFAKAGSNGNEIVIRSSNVPLHYQDGQGKWRTVRSELQPSAVPGVFATNNTPANVQINTMSQYSSITNGDNASITYNRDLELVYIKTDGTEQSLGKANWSNYTAGDDGVNVKDAWPGVDIQMTIRNGGLKTNFSINHPLPAYADGKLTIRDHIQLSDGLSLSVPVQKGYNGDISVLSSTSETLFYISSAIAYERFDSKVKYPLNYSINEHNVLDIDVSGNLLNKAEAFYPLIIDPLVATGTAAAAVVNFSEYAAYCNTTNNLTIPAATTLTDLQYTYEYGGNFATGATDLGDGWYEISTGTCTAPGAPYVGYACAGYSTLIYSCGEATMTSLSSYLSACFPAMSCAAYTLPVVIGCSQEVGATGGACSNHYFYSVDPFVVDVYGTTTADPVAISGSPLVCIGGTTSLSDGTSTGWSWSSSNPGVASVNAATGLVTGVSAGTATITYGPVPCEVTLVVTVSAVTPITGTPTVCIGTTTNLTDATLGGVWSTTAGTGSVNVSGTGVVTGLTGGTATVIYTYPTGCTTSIVVTINTALPAITSTTIFTMCQGSTITLTDATSGGTWSSTNTVVGTVSTTGVVDGVGAGTTTISYASSGGCFATTTVTVYPMPTAILGSTFVVCQGSSILLTDPVAGGNWTTVAGSGTVSVAGGTVTGLTTPPLAAGTATISYSFDAGVCAISAVVTIDPVSPISPAGPVVCSGLTTTVSDAIAGTWSSSTTSVATIVPSTGFISGLIPGTSTIIITYATGCSASTVLTVNISPVAISGTTTLCFGNTTTFIDGTPLGTWSSSNTSIATIVSTTGVATAVSATGGITTIAYTMPITGCNAVTTLTVNPVPAPIQGNMSVCTGLTTSLSDPTTGGGWLSGNTTVGPIGSSSGIVTGENPGTTIITYTLPTGCTALAIVTVNSSPDAIEGDFSMCVGYPTQLSDPSGGGTWTSTIAAVGTVGVTSGIVSPLTSGTTTISYQLATGCAASTTVTVNPVPAPIQGSLSSCAGYFTPLSDVSAGGNWTSSNTSIATVNSITGLVYAVATGASTIKYAFSTTGCYASAVFTVNPSPVAIDGTPLICQGLTSPFNDPTPGGMWSSSNTTIGSVGSTTGLVAGVNPGSTTIIYTLPTTCFVTYPVTITTPPTAINGPASVCHDYAITLSDGTSPGTWSVTPGSGTAAISSSGVLTGGNPGVVTVSYVTPACNAVTLPVVVNPLPAPITGVGNLCVGSGTSLTDATLGGTWSSSNSTATVSSTGVVSGVDTGSGTYISYTLPTGCYVTAPVVVFPIPAPIQGVYTVCPGSYVVLSDITPAGAWSSSNGTIATSIAFTGRVEGMVAGNVNISYTLISGCYVTVPFTVVDPLPASLTVSQSIDSPTCAGTSDILTATAVNGGTPTFEWENWGAYIGNTNPYTFVPTHGDYITCVMTTHNICASPAVVQTSVVLNIYPVVAPQVVITTSAASDSASFLGEVYTFYTDVTYGGVNPGYQWEINDVPVSGATNSTFTTHIYENNEVVTCMVTGTSPCDTPMNTNIGLDSITIYGVNYLSASSLTAGGNDLNLFPNPNTGNFMLSGTLSGATGKDVTLEVTDMVGRTLYTNKTTPQNGTIHADIKLDNDIAAGTYLLRVYTESGTQTFHFVVGK